MFSLYYKPDNNVEVEGINYQVNTSFDNILRLIDMLNDHIPDVVKLKLGLKMLFGKDTKLTNLPVESQRKLFLQVFSSYVNQHEENTIQVDLAGKPVPSYTKDKKNFYSLKYDAEIIYSSFVQAYSIDLIDQQGKLNWFKFQALLAGLPEDTKFRQVVSIRMWEKPNKGDTEEKRMKELQKIYELPEEVD